jgi:hypothetical protein
MAAKGALESIADARTKARIAAWEPVEPLVRAATPNTGTANNQTTPAELIRGIDPTVAAKLPWNFYQLPQYAAITAAQQTWTPGDPTINVPVHLQLNTAAPQADQAAWLTNTQAEGFKQTEAQTYKRTSQNPETPYFDSLTGGRKSQNPKTPIFDLVTGNPDIGDVGTMGQRDEEGLYRTPNLGAITTPPMEQPSEGLVSSKNTPGHNIDLVNNSLPRYQYLDERTAMFPVLASLWNDLANTVANSPMVSGFKQTQTMTEYEKASLDAQNQMLIEKATDPNNSAKDRLVTSLQMSLGTAENAGKSFYGANNPVGTATRAIVEAFNFGMNNVTMAALMKPADYTARGLDSAIEIWSRRIQGKPINEADIWAASGLGATCSPIFTSIWDGIKRRFSDMGSDVVKLKDQATGKSKFDIGEIGNALVGHNILQAFADESRPVLLDMIAGIAPATSEDIGRIDVGNDVINKYLNDLSAQSSQTQQDMRANTGIREEFYRRYKNNESAYALTLELANPERDMVAQSILDPLMLLDFISAPAKLIGMVKNASKDVKFLSWIKAAKTVDTLIDTEKVAKGFATARNAAVTMEEFTQAITDVKPAVSVLVNEVKAENTAKQFATTVGAKASLGKRLVSPTAGANIQDVKKESEIILKTIAAETRNAKLLPAERVETMKRYMTAGMIVAYGEDAPEYDVALAVLAHSPSADTLLSKTGMRLYSALGDILMTEKGELGTTKVLDTLLQASSTGDNAKVLDTIGVLMKDEFPTLARRSEIEAAVAAMRKNNITPTGKMAYWADNPLTEGEKYLVKIGQGGAYTKWRSMQQFFSRYQVKGNPANWGRNWMNNEFTVATGYGLGTLLMDTDAELSNLRRRGLANEASFAGFHSVVSADIGTAPIEEGVKASLSNAKKMLSNLNGHLEQIGQTKAYASAMSDMTNKLRKKGAIIDTELVSQLESVIGKKEAKKYIDLIFDEFNGERGLDRFIKGDRFTVENALDETTAQVFDTLGISTTLRNSKDLSDADKLLAKEKLHAIIKDMANKAPQEHVHLEFNGTDYDHAVSEAIQDLTGLDIDTSLFEKNYNQYLFMREVKTKANTALVSEINGLLGASGIDKGVALQASADVSKKMSALIEETEQLTAAVTRKAQVLRLQSTAGEIPATVRFAETRKLFGESNLKQIEVEEKFIQGLTDILTELKLPTTLIEVSPQLMAARNEMGVLIAYNRINNNQYLLRQGVITFSDQPFVNLFNRMGVPVSESGRPFEAVFMQKYLESIGITDVKWQEIAKGTMTLERRTQLEKAMLEAGNLPRSLTPQEIHAARMKIAPKEAEALAKTEANIIKYQEEVAKYRVIDRKPNVIEEDILGGLSAEEQSAKLAEAQKAFDANIEEQLAGLPPLLRKVKETELRNAAKQRQIDSMAAQNIIDAEKSKIDADVVKKGKQAEAILSKLEEKHTLLLKEIDVIARKQSVTVEGLAQDLISKARLHPDDGFPASTSRFVADNEEALHAGLDRAFAVMGEKFTGKYGDDAYATMQKIAKQATERMEEMRPVLMQHATEQAKFYMLDYAGTYGFDPVLNVVSPYQFWYTRSYPNWVKRLAQNPYLLAEYARYRRFCEQKHSTLPDYLKYSWNTNETFGLNAANPVYYQLENSLWPLNGITGIDYDDPLRRTNAIETFMDDTSKFGASWGTPITLGVGLAHLLLGDKEVAGAWMGRTFPQLTMVKNITALLGIDPFNTGGIELDPFVLIRGGMAKTEITRTAKALADAGENGIAKERVIDAAMSKAGPVWNAAALEGARGPDGMRAVGSILAGIFGQGFQVKTQGELRADAYYADYNVLSSMRPDLSPVEYRTKMVQLLEKYPFAETLLLSRKNGVEQESAFIWSVFARIPPGNLTEFANAVSINPDYLSRFFDNKGDLLKLSPEERMNIMSGAMALGERLAVPVDAVKHEWNYASIAYKALKEKIPSETRSIIEQYEAAKSISKEEGDKLYLANTEVIDGYYSAINQGVMQNPLLLKYYGGLDFIEREYGNIASKEAEKKWPGITVINRKYNDMKDIPGGNQKAFLAAHPELSEYWKYLAAQRKVYEAKIATFAEQMPELPSAKWRPDYKQTASEAIGTLMSKSTPKASILTAAELEKFTGKGPTEDVSGSDDTDVSKYIEVNGERMWPGVVAKDKTYRAKALVSLDDAEKYAIDNPDVLSYRRWARNKRAEYTAFTGGKRVTTTDESTRYPATSQYTARLVRDYFRTGKMPAALETSLRRMWADSGNSMGSFEAWLESLRGAYG